MTKFKDLTFLKKVRYVIGKTLMYALLPLWIILAVVWWKENSLFVMRHINMMFCGVDEY